MTSVLRGHYHKLPLAFRVTVRKSLFRLLDAVGISYVRDYLKFYKRDHQLDNFAGNLLLLKDEYVRSTGHKRQVLSEQFRTIVKALIMKNGVKKITFPGRHDKLLETVLPDERLRLKKDAVKVLDIPSSVGTSSLDACSILSRYYTISSYVLGDLFFELIYDRDRECIFDEDGNLLQVKLKKHFFSIYQPHSLGNEYRIMTYCLMLPFHLTSWYLKNRFRYRSNDNCRVLVLTHPDIDMKLSDNGGVFSLKKMDVLNRIDETFDIILSFNLLLRKYFPREQIIRGIENLSEALNEDGLLIVGSDDAFSISRKIRGKLVTIEQSGEL